VRACRGATFTAASGSLSFSNGHPTRRQKDIQRFQLHLSETGMSICNRNRIMTGIKFSLRVTLRRLDLAAEIYHSREPRKIPQVMSPDETRRVLAVATSLRARAALSLCHGCGLRAGDVVRLEGQAYRRRAEDHSHRAIQGPRGSQCRAVAGDDRSVTAVVEGAPRFRCTHGRTGSIGDKRHRLPSCWRRRGGQLAYLRPQFRMAPTIGPRSRPFSVSTYSARGGLIE